MAVVNWHIEALLKAFSVFTRRLSDVRKLRCDRPYGSVHRVDRLGVVVDAEAVGRSDGDLVLQKKGRIHVSFSCAAGFKLAKQLLEN